MRQRSQQFRQHIVGIEFLFFIIVGAFACGFINGLAGFGTSLFALGWWLQVMTPIEAVAVTLVMAIVSGIQGMLLVWRSIEWPVLLRFLIPAIFGIPLGLQLLSHIDAQILTILVAVFLLIYGGFFSFKKHLPNLTKDMPIVDYSIGLVSGVLGAVAGLSGALPTMLCSMRPWPKMKQRSIIQPFNFFILGLSALLLAQRGVYTANTLKIMAMAFPVTMIASVIGMVVFKQLTDLQYRRLLIILMLVSGLILLAKVLLIRE